MRRVLFLVLGLLLVVWAAPWVANWWGFRGVPNSPRWETAYPGGEFCQFAWPGSAGRKVLVTAMRAPASTIHIATGTAADATAWRRRENGIAATNGGFFDEGGFSEGLRISGGVERSPLRPADWGVFFVANGKARIVHTRDYAAATRTVKVSEAVQCGPRLVVNGRTTQLKPQFARRTGIGIDARGGVIIAVADGEMGFSQWAELWASTGGLASPNALNLDGGPSTQMSFHTRQKSLHVDGGQAVPDAILVRWP